jgi:ABC-type dipeptide/oligopeptide/nickel transport system permease subunit
MTLKWILWNVPIAFIFIDATFEITPVSPYMANLTPIVSLILMILSFIILVLLLIYNSMVNQLDDKDLEKAKGTTDKNMSNIYLDFTWDLGLILLLSAFTFYWSAILYLGHTLMGLMARAVRSEFIKNLEKEYTKRAQTVSE